MCEALTLPCFNRHFPQVFSQSPSGIIAYACRNFIYLIDARCYPPVVLDSKCILKAYKEKIASLSFCKCENTELLASLSDCGEVKIWDINSGTCVNNFVGKEGINNIEWIHGSPNTVVFPQDSKVLIKWNFTTKYMTKIKFGIELKTCFITSNEKCPHLLAVGHNNGTITVLDIVQEKILHRFKDHCREINVLSWSSVSPDTLLSVGSDLSVHSWRMGEDKPIKSFWVGRVKPDDKRRIRCMGICHPKEADVMICSNFYGDIGEVALSDEKPRFKAYSKMSAEISCKILFGLFLGTLKTEQDTVDILYCFDIYTFTTWNITEKKLISFIPLFMGHIYDLSFNPVNSVHLSISNGDGFMRVWNAKADSLASGMITVFVQAKTKIMTAAWHPTWDNLIAFGTDDGKIGLIDIYKRRSMYPFETFHKGKVYSVCWGPCNVSSIEDAESDEYFIYSCGGGELYINRYKKLNAQALNFHEIATRPTELETIENRCSEIVWNSDYSYIFIGTYRGSIEVYDNKLVFLTRCDMEMKAVENLRWHPERTYMSPNGSPLKSWLSCSGNDPTIYILDTLKMLEENSENSADWTVKKLTGHKKPTNGTCWSPHKDGHLASTSKDGSVLIWNVCTGNIIASYLGHSDIVNTVQWSLFDEDIIYSGGQDNFLRMWRISQQKNKAPADKVHYRKKLRKPKLSPRGAEKLQDSEDENGNALTESEISSVVNLETYVDRDKPIESIETENTYERASISRSKGKNAESPNVESNYIQALWTNQESKKSGALFGSTLKSTNKEEDLKDCMKLADILSKKTEETDEIFDPLKPPEETLSDDDTIKFGLYTDQVTALRMADIQTDRYKSSKDMSRFCQLSVMTNKLEPLIREAVENGTLSTYLVTLAPSISFSFWLEICEKYAIQLMQTNQPYVACTYFLMCNKVYEAIDVLKEKGNLIDALGLAKLHLPDSDPVIYNLLISIRKRCRDLSNSIGEVKCYLTMNETLMAVKTLGSVPDVSCIKVAAYISKKYNMKEEAEKYTFIFMQRCLMQCDWESFREFANEEPSLQVYSILFAVHELFYIHLRDVKKQSGIFVKEIFSLPNSKEHVKFWNGVTCLDSDKSFLEYVCDVLVSRNLLPTENSSLETIIKVLDTFLSKWNALDSSSDAHVSIALCITKHILLTLMGDSAAATTNFLKIFESSCNVALLPRVVFMLFFPINLLWSQKMKSILCQSKTHNLENSTNMFVTQYQQFVQSIIEKIATQPHPFDLSIISKDDLQNNLRLVTEKIATALSVKGMDEFVLAYFASYIVHDLSRLMDKKVFALKCCAEKVSASHPENNVDEVFHCKVVDEVPPENNVIVESSENEKAEILKEPPELKALVNSALKEANEKIRILLANTEERVATKDESNIQIKDTPDLCSNEASSNEKVCEKGVILNSANGEYHVVSNGECCVEICSSETASNLGNCTIQVSSTDDSSHAQCLASMELFNHMILFIMSNICKEEFTLLHYLKEHLKFLHGVRAALELSKFSEENKVKLSLKPKLIVSKPKGAKNGKKVHNDKSMNEVQSTAIKTNQVETSKDDDKSEHCNSSVESVNGDPCSDKNNKDERSKPSISATEYVNGDLNTDKINCGKSESSESALESANEAPNVDNEEQREPSRIAAECVGDKPNTSQNNDDKTESSNHAVKSVNTLSNADNVEQREPSHSAAECVGDGPNTGQNDYDKSESSKSALESVNEVPNADNEEQRESSKSALESVNEVPNADNKEQREPSHSAAECVYEPNTSQNNDDKTDSSNHAIKSVNALPNADNEEQREPSHSATECVGDEPNTSQNADDESEFSNSATNPTDQLHSDNNELRTIISNDHNYSYPLKDFDPSGETAVNVVSNETTCQDSDENVLKELIHLLESETKGLSYPSPLDIVPKVLQILYEVRRNSTCNCIQEKLHTLIDDIVRWAGTFQVSNKNFVCEICH